MNGEECSFDTTISITMDDLVESLKLKVLSYYIVLCWNNVGDSSVWDEDMISKLIDEGENKTHPLFQLRILQMLTNAFERLDEILEYSNRDKIITIDGRKLSENIIEKIKYDILQMIGSFECVLSFSNEKIEVEEYSYCKINRYNVE